MKKTIKIILITLLIIILLLIVVLFLFLFFQLKFEKKNNNENRISSENPSISSSNTEYELLKAKFIGENLKVCGLNNYAGENKIGIKGNDDSGNIIEEYESADIYIGQNTKVIDLVSDEDIAIDEIGENDIIVATGDLYDNNFKKIVDAREGTIQVLKESEYDKLRRDTFKGKIELKNIEISKVQYDRDLINQDNFYSTVRIQVKIVKEIEGIDIPVMFKFGIDDTVLETNNKIQELMEKFQPGKKISVIFDNEINDENIELNTAVASKIEFE